MNSLLVAPAIMVGIGLLFGTILAIAQRFLKVDEDPRIEATNELLPGTNCGACGQPGCLPFAEKLVAGEVDPGQCTVSTDAAIEEIAEYLQVDAGRAEKLVARGAVGRKAGRGFYVYGEIAPKTVNPVLADIVQGMGEARASDEEIIERVMGEVAAEARRVVADGIASEKDVDAAMKGVLGWAKGPFEWNNGGAA